MIGLRSLTRLLQHIHTVVFKIFLCSFCCMLIVTVLLEKKILSQVVVLLQTESGCPLGFPYILLH